MASGKGYFYVKTKKRFFFLFFFCFFFFFFVFVFFCCCCCCCCLELSENGINFDISSILFRACFAILCSNIGTH